MKNLLVNTLLSVLILLPSIAHTQQQGNPAQGNSSQWGNEEYTLKATGTGRTTGHVADLTITNLTNSEIVTQEQTAFIPSDGKYQPYIGTIPGTTVPPGQTVTVPVDGVCVDPTIPPVPSGNPMPPISDWVPVAPEIPYTGGGVPVLPTTPVSPFDPASIPDITGLPGYTPTTIPTIPVVSGGPTYVPTWPGTDIPIGGTMNPNDHPPTWGPVLVDALNEIAHAYDKLKEEGKITTPFGGDPVREREAVIQQTFWIYNSKIAGNSYVIEKFTDRVYKQFTDNTNLIPSAIPKNDKDQLDAGIRDFWDTFQATGVEAKILKDVNDTEDPVLISTPSAGVTRTDSINPQVAFNKKLNECFFRKLSYTVDATHSYVRGSGKKQKYSSDKHGGNDKNELVISMKKGDTLDIKLGNLSCECPCWTAQQGGQKSGTFCNCTITGVTQTSYDNVFVKDITADELDQQALAELKKEKQKELDNLKNNNGKKSDIEKLEKNLKDDKEFRKAYDARLKELKKQMEGKFRQGRADGQGSYVAKGSFAGTIEFVFTVHGECLGDLICKASTWSREIKVKLTSK